MPTVSDRMKEAMQIRGLTQTELAEKSGINKGSLSSYLSGRYSPKQQNLALLAQAMDVSELWLTGADVSMEPEASSSPDRSSAKNEPGSYPNVLADFCLRAADDSMLNARIHSGDLVFVRRQESVENGEIAVVLLRNEKQATLRRLYYYREKSMMILKAENPSCEDSVFTGGEIQDVQVLGKAVAFQSSLK